MESQIDSLALRTWCGGEIGDLPSLVWQANDMHEAFLSLRTDESKVAYLVFSTANLLNEIDTALDSKTSKLLSTVTQKKDLSPNDLPFHLLECTQSYNPQRKVITIAALGHFEDLYYASAAKLKELEQQVTIMLNNHFAEEESAYFSFKEAPLNILGSISYKMCQKLLAVQREILLDGHFISVLARGVIRTNAQSFLIKKTPHEQAQGVKGLTTAMKPLLDVQNMTSGMIYGLLAEKYHVDMPAKEKPVEAKPVSKSDQFKAFGAAARKRKASRDIVAEEAAKIVRATERKKRMANRHSWNGAIQASSDKGTGKVQIAQGDEHPDGVVANSAMMNHDASLDPHPEAPLLGATTISTQAGHQDYHKVGATSPFMGNTITSSGQAYSDSTYSDEDVEGTPFTSPEQIPAHLFVDTQYTEQYDDYAATTGLAGKPCVCSMECICYHLCRSQVPQNCLCEDNYSFGEPSEGAYIDDLSKFDMAPAPWKQDAYHRSAYTGPSETQATNNDDEELDATVAQISNYFITKPDSSLPVPHFEVQHESRFQTAVPSHLVRGLDYIRFGYLTCWRPDGMTRDQFARWLATSPFEQTSEPIQWPSKRSSVKNFFRGRKSFLPSNLTLK